MWLEGPEGSITTVDTNPQPQGGGVRGDMVMVEALGDTLRPCLNCIHRKIEKKRWRGQRWGWPSASAYKHQSKKLFHTQLNKLAVTGRNTNV